LDRFEDCPLACITKEKRKRGLINPFLVLKIMILFSPVL
jgi:hypothetical protein